MIFIILGGLIIYFPSLKYGFAQDDFIHLSAGQARSFGDFLSFFNPKSQYPDIFFYRPLGTQVYFFINSNLFGLNPLPFRTEALTLHLINSLLFFLIVKKLLKNNYLSLISTLFYTISSIHFLSLYYISAFQQIIKTFFLLLSLILFLNYLQTRSRIFFISSLLTFTFSLLSKETSIVFPLLLFPLEILRRQSDKLRKIIKDTSMLSTPYFLIIVIYGLLRLSGFQSIFTTGDYRTTFSLFEIAQNLKWYLIWSLGLPEILSTISSLKPQTLLQFGHDLPFGNMVLLLSFIFIILFSITVARTKLPDNRVLLSALFLFLIPLLPMLIIYQHRYPHYLDLSFLGLLPLISWYLVNNQVWKKTLSGVIILAFILLQIFSLKLSEATHWSTHRAQVADFYHQSLKEKYPDLASGKKIIFTGTDLSTKELSITLAKHYALSSWYPGRSLEVSYQASILDTDLQNPAGIIFPITKY